MRFALPFFGDWSLNPIKVLFIPHIIPAPRGILSTISFEASEPKSEEELFNVLVQDYGKEPFVRILSPGLLPNTRNVNGTNLIEIGITVDVRTGRTILVSAIEGV